MTVTTLLVSLCALLRHSATSFSEFSVVVAPTDDPGLVTCSLVGWQQITNGLTESYTIESQVARTASNRRGSTHMTFLSFLYQDCPD